MVTYLTQVMALEESTATMSSLITDLSTVVTAIFGWIGTVCSTITSTPLLLLTVGFLVLGGAIGMVGRLLSRH